MERTLVASRFPTELCAGQSGGFRAVGVDSWLVGAGWLEISRTSDYLGIIVFFIKEMDSAWQNYPYILASYLSLINLSNSSIMSTYGTSQTNVGYLVVWWGITVYWQPSGRRQL